MEPHIDKKFHKKRKMGDCMESADYVRNNPDIVPDYKYYVEKQLKKPLVQLLALRIEDLTCYKKYVETLKQDPIKASRAFLIEVKKLTPGTLPFDMALFEFKQSVLSKLLFQRIDKELETMKVRKYMGGKSLNGYYTFTDAATAAAAAVASAPPPAPTPPPSKKPTKKKPTTTSKKTTETTQSEQPKRARNGIDTFFTALDRPEGSKVAPKAPPAPAAKPKQGSAKKKGAVTKK
jgi:hypothetical protein